MNTNIAACLLDVAFVVVSACSSVKTQLMQLSCVHKSSPRSESGAQLLTRIRGTKQTEKQTAQSQCRCQRTDVRNMAARVPFRLRSFS